MTALDKCFILRRGVSRRLSRALQDESGEGLHQARLVEQLDMIAAGCCQAASDCPVSAATSALFGPGGPGNDAIAVVWSCGPT